jgi:hypothetical protein
VQNLDTDLSNKNRTCRARHCDGYLKSRVYELVHDHDTRKGEYSAMKARLESYDSLFAKLRVTPPEEVQTLLAEMSLAPPLPMNVTLIPTKLRKPDQDRQYSQSSVPGGSNNVPRDAQGTGSRKPPPTESGPPKVVKGKENAFRTPLLENISWRPNLAPIINSLVVQGAVDAFFSGSGKLFHVFSAPQVARIREDISSA